MKPTKELQAEHRAIDRMLGIMGGVCDRLESGAQVNPGHLEQIVEFIRVFADKCHHGKEEDLLFVAMEEAGVPRQGGPIGVMLTEHTRGRNYVQNMSQAIAQYKAGQQAAAPQIVENARGYIALLNQHIAKEDNILYPMANGVLSQAKQDELSEGFEVIEHERIGAGQHEAFHKLLEDLERIYVGSAGKDA